MLSYLLSIIEKNLTIKLSSIYSNTKIQQFKENYLAFQKKSKFILPDRLFIHDVFNKKKLDINNFIMMYKDLLNDIQLEITSMFEMVRKISEIICVIFQGIFEKMRNGLLEVKDFKENDTIIEINSLLSCLDLKMYVIDVLNKKISEDGFLKYCLICLKSSNPKTLLIEALTYENYGSSDFMNLHSKFFINCLILNGMNQEYFPKTNHNFIEFFNKKNLVPILEEIKSIKRETWKYINNNLKSIVKLIKEQEVGEVDNKTDYSKKIKRNSQISYISNDDTTLSYNDNNNYSDIDSLVNFINEKGASKNKKFKTKEENQKRTNRIYSETSTSDVSKVKRFIDNGSENSNYDALKKNEFKKMQNDGKTCKISSFKSMRINHLSNIDKSVKEEKDEFSDNENYFKLDAKKFLDSTKSINEEEEYFNITKKYNLKSSNENQIITLDDQDDEKFVEEFKKNLKKDSIHTNYKWKINLEDENEISF